MAENREKIFVFVVCGQSAHIETLNFSLKYLKKFSSCRSVVVTDSRLNGAVIEHEHVIDVRTPDNFDNHRASIWLKTSLHRILPPGPLYCYLDSDVIAVSEKCDEVFSNYSSPVTFAADHCSIQWFSPYAVNCGCSEKYSAEKIGFETAVKKVVKNENYPPDYRNRYVRELFRLMNGLSKKPFSNILPVFRIILAFLFGRARIKGDLFVDSRKKEWQRDGFTFPFLFLFRKEIKRETGYRYAVFSNKWLKNNGEQLPENKCGHLVFQIKNDLGITIDPQWQHWNGGVFLFGKESDAFMDKWHELTLKIFKLNEWKTRDQGTLIATAWEKGLQSHKILEERFNFIADFFNCNIIYSKSNGKIEVEKDGKRIIPAFIHVYHEFGNKEWELWRMIESIIK